MVTEHHRLQRQRTPTTRRHARLEMRQYVRLRQRHPGHKIAPHGNQITLLTFRDHHLAIQPQTAQIKGGQTPAGQGRQGSDGASKPGALVVHIGRQGHAHLQLLAVELERLYLHGRRQGNALFQPLQKGVWIGCQLTHGHLRNGRSSH